MTQLRCTGKLGGSAGARDAYSTFGSGTLSAQLDPVAFSLAGQKTSKQPEMLRHLGFLEDFPSLFLRGGLTMQPRLASDFLCSPFASAS